MSTALTALLGGYALAPPPTAGVGEPIALALDPAPGPGGTVTFALDLASATLGLAVGYIALRGYLRNGSLPMLFVAAGFALAFWTPVFLDLAFVALDAVGEFAPGMRSSVRWAFATAGEVSRLAGLVCVLYGLRMPIRE